MWLIFYIWFILLENIEYTNNICCTWLLWTKAESAAKPSLVIVCYYLLLCYYNMTFLSMFRCSNVFWKSINRKNFIQFALSLLAKLIRGHNKAKGRDFLYRANATHHIHMAFKCSSNTEPHGDGECLLSFVAINKWMSRASGASCIWVDVLICVHWLLTSVVQPHPPETNWVRWGWLNTHISPTLNSGWMESSLC